MRLSNYISFSFVTLQGKIDVASCHVRSSFIDVVSSTTSATLSQQVALYFNSLIDVIVTSVSLSQPLQIFHVSPSHSINVFDLPVLVVMILVRDASRFGFNISRVTRYFRKKLKVRPSVSMSGRRCGNVSGTHY